MLTTAPGVSMIKEECSVCKFWLSQFDDLEIEEAGNEAEYDPIKIMSLKETGMCRRYPPVAVNHKEDGQGFYSFNGDATDFFEFVHTTPCDWCGEFVMKPNAAVTGV